MSTWTKTPYGIVERGRWTISNGTLNFDIHPLVNGSRPFNPGSPPHMTVTSQEADAYADYVLDALNAYDRPIPSGESR